MIGAETLDQIKMLNAPLENEVTIVLFGSSARGDNNENSDIDIAIITKNFTPKPKNLINQKINITMYTESKIFEMAREGSLFIKHLISEGIVLDGDRSFLKKIKEHFSANDYHKYISELMFSLKYLDITQEEYFFKWEKYNQTAIFLFRSFIYLMAERHSINSFSMKEISKELSNDKIFDLYNLKYSKKPLYESFLEIKKYLENLTNSKITNEFISLDALLVNSNSIGKLPVWIGLNITKPADDEFTYE